MTHQEIINTLRRARRGEDIVQVVLADTSGIDRTMISHWERQYHSPRLHNLIAWAESLGYVVEVKKINGHV